MKTQECRVEVPGVCFTRSLNDATAQVKVQGGLLELTSGAQKDYFTDPDGKLSNNTAPVLLIEQDNAKPFTFIARLTPLFQERYDAGALYVFVNDGLWQKFAMERDERGRVRIVSVRTIGSSDDNNHDVIVQKSIFMKISSDTKTVAFYYSLEGAEWQLVRLYKNDYPPVVWLGISSQSPIGSGNKTCFDQLSLTQQAVSDFRLGV